MTLKIAARLGSLDPNTLKPEACRGTDTPVLGCQTNYSYIKTQSISASGSNLAIPGYTFIFFGPQNTASMKNSISFDLYSLNFGSDQIIVNNTTTSIANKYIACTDPRDGTGDLNNIFSTKDLIFKLNKGNIELDKIGITLGIIPPNSIPYSTPGANGTTISPSGQPGSCGCPGGRGGDGYSGVPGDNGGNGGRGGDGAPGCKGGDGGTGGDGNGPNVRGGTAGVGGGGGKGGDGGQGDFTGNGKGGTGGTGGGTGGGVGTTGTVSTGGAGGGAGSQGIGYKCSFTINGVNQNTMKQSRWKNYLSLQWECS